MYTQFCSMICFWIRQHLWIAVMLIVLPLGQLDKPKTNGLYALSYSQSETYSRLGSSRVGRRTYYEKAFKLPYLDTIFENYDSSAWPNYLDGKPTTVHVSIYIITLGPFDTAEMDYNLEIYLQQSWYDPRLNLFRFGVNTTLSLNGADIAPMMWKPDLYFANAKHSATHDVTMPNELVDITPKGEVYYSMRLTLELACLMTFRRYPLDIQRCPLTLGTFAQTTEQTLLKWEKTNPIVYENDVEIPQFLLTETTYDSYNRSFDTGSFSLLRVEFTVSRDRGFYLINMYFPTLLCVVISWFAFYIRLDNAPARVILDLGMLLNLLSVNTGVRSELPPVSYIKALDVWMGACVCAVFASLLVFILVNYMGRIKQRPKFYRQVDDTAFVLLTKRKDLAEDPGSYDNEEYDELYRNVKRAQGIDRVARVIFPSVFLIFNIVYWSMYGSQVYLSVYGDLVRVY